MQESDQLRGKFGLILCIAVSAYWILLRTHYEHECLVRPGKTQSPQVALPTACVPNLSSCKGSGLALPDRTAS